MNVNLHEIVKRVIKYLVEGLIIALAAYAIPQKSLQFDEIAVIGLVAAATFSILDTFLPTVADNARQGAGLGVGFGLVGFNGINKGF
jgi:uncharacterized RDD family membrane protein YckC